ncbi:hypothetical protein H0H81_005893 [Sphagnurus paluster]|uniref:Uncharacterized protein n=1 Tax=Sphagnurus paluster TaxID=117069 RepID=A0A9P7FYP3_9AGAR|nr:hypothetical protein H0H81_005893 [Sphagnurus paluster]
MSPHNRSASLLITVFGAISNFAVAVQLIAAWRSLRWEPESEWEASGDAWRVDVVKVIWGLLSAYFVSSVMVCVVGFIGIIKVRSLLFFSLQVAISPRGPQSKPAHVRFYRDYSIADFSFCTFVTVVTTYAVFHASARATICEELSHHPELLRDLMEMGLNLENCERWLERAVFAFVALMFVLIVIRLHFLLAVSNFYSHLTRHVHLHSHQRSSSTRFRHQESSTLTRIYLLPPHASDEEAQRTGDVELVYAPVPLSTVPKDLRDAATEAWVSRQAPSSAADGSPAPGRPHTHTRPRAGSVTYIHAQQQQQQQDQRAHRNRRHSYSQSCGQAHRRTRSSSSTRTGTIRLPILPDEGLLPPYRDSGKA